MRPLLLEQLNSHPGGPPLEALQASGADRRLDCLVGVSVSPAWQVETNLSCYVAVELHWGVLLSVPSLSGLTSAVDYM